MFQNIILYFTCLLHLSFMHLDVPNSHVRCTVGYVRVGRARWGIPI
uniref:Uncharacterized protein n=1 Tax=Nelumbo nucifera TaxID=4432 RepID=A0A822YG52_NELNU|nr:TPA_asm: hypothetical protein HUJ06_029956 [Nelumbo nucifera]